MIKLIKTILSPAFTLVSVVGFALLGAVFVLVYAESSQEVTLKSLLVASMVAGWWVLLTSLRAIADKRWVDFLFVLLIAQPAVSAAFSAALSAVAGAPIKAIYLLPWGMAAWHTVPDVLGRQFFVVAIGGGVLIGVLASRVQAKLETKPTQISTPH
ncbi:MAG: hypothetical protein JNN20_05095 [Betaproteobacteria bacterium]|nr:hypothetical protein [Betaproteobacteria bacterium]